MHLFPTPTWRLTTICVTQFLLLASTCTCTACSCAHTYIQVKYSYTNIYTQVKKIQMKCSHDCRNQSSQQNFKRPTQEANWLMISFLSPDYSRLLMQVAYFLTVPMQSHKLPNYGNKIMRNSIGVISTDHRKSHIYNQPNKIL